MARDDSKMILMKDGQRVAVVDFVWSISRGRDTYGYNICTCFVDGEKVGRVNGGGYDMHGAALSGWIAKQVYEDARNGIAREFYGLTWHDPDYKTPEAIANDPDNLGLATYRDYYKASSKVRTDRHIIPNVDGACGMDGIIRGAGFTYWEISKWTTQAVKRYVRDYYPEENTATWERSARHAGFRAAGRGTWERWPADSQ